MLYLDTSVLLVYTLTQSVERVRHAATRVFFAQVKSGALSAATSFHALHEVHLFALANAPDQATGAAYGKAALAQILTLPLQILPLVSRVERAQHARIFRDLRDPADVPHAIAAWVAQCEAIVAYDSHFKAIAHLIPYRTPEDFLE
ncbi:MAG: PIN domain-containing protein [Nitrospira sp.]|nr:MAG: PIN domain-containing protein [Nitrospira sp.]